MLNITPYSASPALIDIFCRVIDNYGDIGVCWRLAKDLQNHLHIAQINPDYFDPASLLQTLFKHHPTIPNTIRLWVDDLYSFARLEPRIDPHKTQQIIQGIHIMHWQDNTVSQAQPAPLVIEAFGANLDEGFIQQMKGQTRYWLNVEYLSAEPWVESFHAQPSIQANGVAKYFFFPGFTSKTGGLIRETTLLPSLANFHQAEKYQWLLQYIGKEVADAFIQGDQLITLFCYPHAPFLSLLQGLQANHRPTLLLIPEGVLPQAEQLLQSTHADFIRIKRFAFLPQEQFDYLLACSTFNIVRGEDSFVRAIWSGIPFIWHIYPQEENIHLEKLHAWLNSYPFDTRLITLNTAWNEVSSCSSSIDSGKLTTSSNTLSKAFTQLFQSDQLHSLQQSLLDYRQHLLKNQTLSFSILNFQAKHG
ncbi:elongation factor P maturation arginine rhamnosyltransferase EarP [Pelistega ratti]|uniref:elongation factor P maturation arginine rhamnosyltransferase EarP n=1 Tax=Pelistega ratti TaxID=2652177 RepID=UPI001357B4E5|nr:elongation factor P maturation arginine rhamnosyltransferase EarP [Pelistega ratti]